MKTVLFIIGIVAFLIGLLWIGQGLGYIHWPAGTFMTGESRWTIYGAILAVVGLIIMFFSRYSK